MAEGGIRKKGGRGGKYALSGGCAKVGGGKGG